MVWRPRSPNGPGEHGASDDTVTVRLDGGDTDFAIRVHNRGTPIAADHMNGLFNPMKLNDSCQKSLAQGTTFSVHLPRSETLDP